LTIICLFQIPYYEWVTKTRPYKQTKYLESKVKTAAGVETSTE